MVGIARIMHPDEIEKVQALLAAGTVNGHTCGFDWSVGFWASPSEVLDGFSINEGCTRYDPRLKPYFHQLRDRPTHFIYNLKVPVDVHPEQVIHDLEEWNLAVFLLYGPNPHLPRIDLAVLILFEAETEDRSDVARRGEANVRSLVERLVEDYAVESVRIIGCTSWTFPGEEGARSSCRATATVWFELGADWNGIETEIESLGGSLRNKEIPNYYNVQLVVDEQNLEKVQQRVTSNLEYSVDVSTYSPLPPRPTPSVDTSTRQFYWMTDRSLRLDAEGHPNMAYGKYQLYYAWHDGVGWHHETADEVPGVGMSASMVLDGAGYPHISYYDQINDDLNYAYRDGSGWHAETVDSKGRVGLYASLALGSDGYAHISYCDETNENLKYAYRSASGWHTETVDDSRGVACHTSLTLDRAGYPHISYYDHMYAVVKYAYQDASGWHIEAVDRAGFNGGGHTSLALDSAGHPHISYSDGHPNYVLKYAHQDASNWHVETLDSVGGGGAYTSLALDRDGYPHVSYYCWDSGPLKYVYQDASGWHVEMVDSEKCELRSTSLALDDGGQPHIGYGMCQ